MKIFILHPVSSTNLGDHAILAGTINLLKLAVDAEIIECDLDKAENDEEYVSSFIEAGFDCFVVSGTPWIWDMCHQSKKFQILESIVSRLPKACKKIAMGIGSCFPFATNTMTNYLWQMDDNGNYEITRKHTREKLYGVFSQFDLVVCRDRFAFHILQSLSLPIIDGICPAAFLPNYQINKANGKRPLLVFIDPYKSISCKACDEKFLEDYIQFQKWFKKEYNPKIITIDPLSRDWCVGQKWDTSLIQSLPELAQIVNNASFIISGKVHATIPAAVWGIRSYILPIDTRYLTCVRLGVWPILTYSDMDWWMLRFVNADEAWKIKVKKVIESHKQFLISKIRELL